MDETARAYIKNKDKKMRRKELKRNLIIAGGAAIVVGIVILEKRRVDGLIEMSQAAVYDTMMGSFDEGVKYGVQLSKELGLNAAAASEYAFAAFDKSK